jgi:two-component system cell cycle response regulator CtrA
MSIIQRLLSPAATVSADFAPAERGASVVPLSRARVQTMRALVLENDLTGSSRMSSALSSAGFGVEHANAIDEAIDLCRYYDFDAVVVDLRPDLLGCQAICRLRAAGIDVPLLFIAACTTAEARIKALSLGADDVVVAGLCERELDARLKALVRRSRGLSHPKLRVGRLTLDLLAREVSVDGRVVELSNKEYAMLEVMATRMGAAVRKETFLHQLYGGLDEPSLKTIDVMICRLRQKLAAAGADGVVRTVYGHGYAMRDTTDRTARGHGQNRARLLAA